MTIEPKNWLDFQHYRDRKPVWIKLHRDLLNDYEFMMLQDDSKMLAPLLWLLASEYQDGIITAHIDKIAFRLHIDKDRLKLSLINLIEADFFEADSEMMGVLIGSDINMVQPASKMVQNACVETEKRREEKRTFIDDDFNSFWSAYPRKVSKGNAEKAFRKHYKQLPKIDDLIKIVELKKKSLSWLKDEGQFIPHASTWLNAKGWEDEIETNHKPTTSGRTLGGYSV